VKAGEHEQGGCRAIEGPNEGDNALTSRLIQTIGGGADWFAMIKIRWRNERPFQGKPDPGTGCVAGPG